MTGYTLSALLFLALTVAACGVVFFAGVLAFRAAEWNDRRKARAQRYRARIGGRY